MTSKNLFIIIVFCVAGLTVSGLLNFACEHANPVKQAPTASTFNDIQQNIFNKSCAVSSCHLGSSAPLGLDLSAGHAYGNLVDVASQEIPSLKRVKPGDPNNSYLVMKIEGAPGIQGERMPRGGSKLAQEDIDAIRQWIANGALPTEGTPVVSDIPNQTIERGQSFSPIHLDDFVTDPDTPDEQIAWTFSGNSEISIVIDASRVATIGVVDTTWTGSETVVFTATDPTGLSATDEVIFTVSPPQITFSFIQENVFTPNCAISGCHLGPSAPHSLDLSAGSAYGNLVNVASAEVPTLNRVNPGEPDSSYLVLKVEGDPSIQGVRMPYGGNKLPQDLIDAIRQWISDGAPNN